MNTPSLQSNLRRPALILLAILSAVSAQPVFAADEPASSGPLYRDKPVAYWVAALETPQSASGRPKQVEAEEAIHALGPDAIPFILRYQQGNRAQRLDLIRHACAVIGPEGEAKIVDALADLDSSVRENALEALPKSAVPAAMGDILKLLGDPAQPVRSAAIRTLVRLAPGDPETITALIEALHDANPASDQSDSAFTSEDAAITLGKLGAKAKAAVPALTELLTDSNDALREAAATALWRIEKSPRGVTVLAERLDEAQDYQTCVRVMKTLAEMGPAAKSAVPVIQKKIEEPGVPFVPATVDLGQLAVDTLAKIDPKAAAESRKKLEELSQDKQ
jgi:HEAT repeats/HEAT repeat